MQHLYDDFDAFWRDYINQFAKNFKPRVYLRPNETPAVRRRDWPAVSHSAHSVLGPPPPAPTPDELLAPWRNFLAARYGGGDDK